jgi:hypothetical protein
MLGTAQQPLSGMMLGTMRTPLLNVFRQCTVTAPAKMSQWNRSVPQAHSTRPRLCRAFHTKLLLSSTNYIRLSFRLRSLARDERRGLFCLGLGKLDSGSLYRPLQSRNVPPQPAAKFIWNSHAPPRVQFFVWLLVHGRIQCRATLFRKAIVDSPVCEICNLADETSTHIVFGCRFAEEFWVKLGIQPTQSANDGCLFSLTSLNHFPSKHFSTFVALCYWNLWKRRNGFFFRNEALTHQQVFRLIHNDAKLWKSRLPKRDKLIADAWCNIMSPFPSLNSHG